MRCVRRVSIDEALGGFRKSSFCMFDTISANLLHCQLKCVIQAGCVSRGYVDIVVKQKFHLVDFVPSECVLNKIPSCEC